MLRKPVLSEVSLSIEPRAVMMLHDNRILDVADRILQMEDGSLQTAS
jgi:ABC-type lipoprotein export system ATPase subunit